MTKTPRKPKTAANVPGSPGSPEPGAAGSSPGTGHNSAAPLTIDQEAALFQHHLTKWADWKNKRAVVDEFESDMKANIRSDGFLVKDMQIADKFNDPKGDKQVTDDLKRTLKIARLIGHPMGRQMDMFDEPDRTPSVDRAFDDGKQKGREGAPRTPPFSPDVPQYGKWMDGYTEGNRTMAEAGFRKKVDPVTEPASQNETLQ